jgi:hypothetical protein
VSARVCDVCGYALNVQAVAVLREGRIVLEVRLCGACYVRALDELEHAIDYRIAARK